MAQCSSICHAKKRPGIRSPGTQGNARECDHEDTSITPASEGRELGAQKQAYWEDRDSASKNEVEEWSRKVLDKNLIYICT